MAEYGRISIDYEERAGSGRAMGVVKTHKSLDGMGGEILFLCVLREPSGKMGRWHMTDFYSEHPNLGMHVKHAVPLNEQDIAGFIAQGLGVERVLSIDDYDPLPHPRGEHAEDLESSWRYGEKTAVRRSASESPSAGLPNDRLAADWF